MFEAVVDGPHMARQFAGRLASPLGDACSMEAKFGPGGQGADCLAEDHMQHADAKAPEGGSGGRCKVCAGQDTPSLDARSAMHRACVEREGASHSSQKIDESGSVTSRSKVWKAFTQCPLSARHGKDREFPNWPVCIATFTIRSDVKSNRACNHSGAFLPRSFAIAPWGM